MTQHQLRKMERIAASWLGPLASQYNLPDIVHEAVCNALETKDTMPATWEKHCVYHTISLVRQILEREKSGQAERLLTVALPADYDTEDPITDEEYEERKEQRSYTVDQVLKRMPSDQATLLRLTYEHNMSLRKIATFMRVSHITVRNKLETAKRTFTQILTAIATDHPDWAQVASQPNVESGSMWSDLRPLRSKRLDCWYRPEQESDGRAWYDRDGVLHHASRGREELKERCTVARQQKSHSPAAHIATLTPQQNGIQS